MAGQFGHERWQSRRAASCDRGMEAGLEAALTMRSGVGGKCL